MHLSPSDSSIKLNTSCWMKQHFPAKEHSCVVRGTHSKHHPACTSPSSFPGGTEGGGKNIPSICMSPFASEKLSALPSGALRGLAESISQESLPTWLWWSWGKSQKSRLWIGRGKKISKLLLSHCNRIVSWSHEDWQHPQSSQSTGRRMSFTGAGMLHRQFLADPGGKGVSWERGEPPWILNQQLDIALQAVSWGCHFYFILLVSSYQKLKLLCLVGILLQNE